MLQQILEF